MEIFHIFSISFVIRSVMILMMMMVIVFHYHYHTDNYQVFVLEVVHAEVLVVVEEVIVVVEDVLIVVVE